ncbi:uncharacterized protein LOC132715756 [Ruditapes philippinarum]|uniref:uncharacterized protein LOC132715756 n=1 Tax=Ruditapes philippinarum TaxID=129788 RepID=UPI00295B1418|nr:uncharacterized protein LOC132715756 [Ruditapes philippinarum]XP_060554803.1 uncharacterized protein LOC132715756 [Ruditapes philippinarum]XP_060554804.1 uncharacterized protein LOC132715756 [Ruditapes philippinarum]XP_060554805.1 uncharacterized protein LOC132715756 [Ruditapes philippinarum]
MDEDNHPSRSRHIPAVGACLLIVFSILSRSGTSILTPLWLDAENNHTDNVTTSCDTRNSDHQIDAYTIMFITNFIFVMLFGVVLLVTKFVCPYLITERETKYNKKEFALIGVSDTVSGICFVYASSGCRTAPYLQSLAANFSVPVTFIIRFLVLRKRPTCRKTFCAVLVLFAEFTALLPDIFPGLESQQARKDQGGTLGAPGILWPLCFFFGFIPMALVSIIIEKTVKSSLPAQRRPNDDDMDINIAYFLFWSYLFSLLSLMLLFWTDIIPGFGMSDNIVDFSTGFWFNVKCFFGYEGCRGTINVISGTCVVLLLLNRITNSYFLRYLEGANYLSIITAVQTPVVFIFFTLFDENPLKWHPHAYLSTWLSVAALCIMIPAIYIYDTGAPEVVPHEQEHVNRVSDSAVQTDDSPLIDTDVNQNNDHDGTCRLRYDSEPPPFLIDFESDNQQLNQNIQRENPRKRIGTSTGLVQLPHEVDEVTRLLCDTDEQTVSFNYGSNQVHSHEATNNAWNV